MTLQYALVLIGIIVVVLVALTSLAKSRRARRAEEPPVHVDGLDSPPPEDRPALEPLDIALSPAASAQKRALKVDPSFDLAEPSTEDRFRNELETIEDVASMPLNLNPGFDRPRHTDQDIGAPSWIAMPDEHIDFVIHFPGAGPVTRDRALGIYKQHEYNLDKPRFLFGRRFKTQYWSNLEKDSARTEYADLALAIQTVDNRGPIDETELNTFVQVGLKLADALQRHPKLPRTLEEGLQRATRLQQFCDDYDVIASVSLVSQKGKFRGPDIERAARKLGLQFGAMNIFHMKNEQTFGCRHLFSVANMYQPGEFDPENWEGVATDGLSFFMSVPCAHQPELVFDKMIAVAKGMSRALSGRLLDQERKPLTDEGVAIIRAQIDGIADKMRGSGIVAGSSSALRLFATGLD